MVIEMPAQKEIHERPCLKEPKAEKKGELISLTATAAPVVEALPMVEVEEMYIEPQTDKASSRTKGSYKSFGLALVIVTVTFVLKWLISSVLV